MNEMVVIEVNFGKDKKDSILVHFNDHPEELSKAFVKRHNLKDSVSHHILHSILGSKSFRSQFHSYSHPFFEQAIPRVTQYIEKTIDDFKMKSGEIRAQTPPMGKIISEKKSCCC